MSLVPYYTTESTETVDTTPLVVGTAFVLAATMYNMFQNRENEEEEVVEEHPQHTLIPTYAVGEHPLDLLILRILEKTTTPLATKEILKRIQNEETERTSKSEINSRLYTMLSRKIVAKQVTKKAPLWSVA